MRRKKIKDLQYLLIAFLILGAFGYLLSKNPTPNKQLSESQPEIKEEVQTEVKPEPKTEPIDLSKVKTIFLTKDGVVKNIVITSESDKATKEVYSDKDQSSRILQAVGSSGSKIYFIEGENLSQQNGTLVSIDLDGKNKKDVLKDVSLAPEPVLSPDGKKLLTVGFSQAEREIGFIITLRDLAGGDDIVVVKQLPGVLYPAFLGNNILYAYDINQKAGLKLIDQKGKLLKETTLDGRIQNLASWGDKILLSVSPRGKDTINQAKISVLNSELISDQISIKDQIGAEVDLIGTEKELVFRRVQFKKEVWEGELIEGDVTAYNIEKQTETVLGKGIKLIGVASE